MKYRVLHIFSSKTAGGAEKKTLFLAESLQKAGICDNIMGVTKGTYMFEQSAAKGLETVDFKAGGSLDPAGISRLIRIIGKYDIDIVHAHQGKLYWQALIARILRAGTKAVFHRRQDTRHGFYSRLHYRFADAVITVSKAVSEGLIKYEKAPAEKVFTVYNGLDFDKFDAGAGCGDIIKAYGLEGKRVIGTAGAIVDFKGKGQIYLIEAAAKLRKDYPDLRYLIVGAGAGMEKQKEYAERLGVEDIVCFTGYQEQVHKYILAMDIFCLLSWDTEGVGNVLIEAQALGKPVIGTDIGGIPETFIDGKSGILIKPSSADETAAAIRSLLDDPAKAAEFAKAGREFVRSRFTIENMVKATADVYNKIMADKK